MDPSRWDKLQNMVLGAQELPLEDQDPYLRAASNGDPTLFEQATEILKGSRSDSTFMSKPIGSVDALLEARRKKNTWLQRIFGLKIFLGMWVLIFGFI